MPDKKITELTAATTPLTGTETVPVVQGNVTKKVPVSSLTAGRDTDVKKLTASDNVVIGTAGKGVDFSAAPGPINSATEYGALLADYNEGAWVPVDASGAGLTFAAREAYYVKTGSLVVATCHIVYPSTASAVDAVIGGLPFTSKAVSASMFAAAVSLSTYSSAFSGVVVSNSTNVALYKPGAAAVKNSDLSGQIVRMTITYQV